MKCVIKALFIFSFTGIFAQVEIHKSSLAPVGGTATSGTRYMVHVGGEIANREGTNGTFHLSEGFIGPDFVQLLQIKDYEELEGVQIYPNPVKDYLHIGLPSTDTFEIHLFSLDGKEIWQTQTSEGSYTADMRDLSASMYLLVVIDRQNKSYATYKIQKQ